MAGMTLFDQVIYTTVKISALRAGQVTSTGTGFFWNTRLEDGRMSSNIVTNKHVIKDADAIVVKCHLQATGSEEPLVGQFFDWMITLDHQRLIYHPGDVDLVLLGFSGAIDISAKNGKPIFYKAFSSDVIPQDNQWADFDAIEEVLMVGCPNGLVDEKNNRPIVRRGVTATSLGLLYNGKPEFMVDMACFPGSSGSPVFISQTSYRDRKTNNILMGASRFFLAGILYAGPLYNQQGTITFGASASFTTASMIHLGNVIRSSELKVIDDLLLAKLAT